MTDIAPMIIDSFAGGGERISSCGKKGSGMTGTLTCSLCDLGAKPIKPGEWCTLCGRVKK